MGEVLSVEALLRGGARGGWSVALNTLVTAEIKYLFNCRHLTETTLTRKGFLGNRYVLLAVALLIE